MSLGPYVHVDARLTDAEGGHLVVIGPMRHEPCQRPELWVAQSLPKGRKFDEVLRQVTELRVDGIVMVAADHSVTRLDRATVERHRNRWSRVATAASEPSRRPRRPDLLGKVEVGASTTCQVW